MKVAVYARVSTSDREQNPETQLLPLRDFCQAQGWEVHREYVDQVSANDIARRLAWRDLLDDAAKRRFTVVLVFKLDRAFRSVKHMHDTLAAWETVGVSFKSLREQFDTSTALGRLLLNLLASLAEFELELIREWVKAGMERARRQGKRIGRPRVSERRGFSRDFGAILERLQAGSLSRRRAARELGDRLCDPQAPAGRPGPFDGLRAGSFGRLRTGQGGGGLDGSPATAARTGASAQGKPAPGEDTGQHGALCPGLGAGARPARKLRPN
ncbi:MAG: recombinase family protein [Chloroflexi bacterium]|nr:recombinase family protein [Chloroflexota bacterium]